MLSIDSLMQVRCCDVCSTHLLLPASSPISESCHIDFQHDDCPYFFKGTVLYSDWLICAACCMLSDVGVGDYTTDV